MGTIPGRIAAFYCIIHIPREQVLAALRELKRVLKLGGVLLVTFHIGQEIKHLDEWWDKRVNLDFAFFLPEEMEVWLKEAGYDLEETLVREPNPEVEMATRRAYFFARKQGRSKSKDNDHNPPLFTENLASMKKPAITTRRAKSPWKLTYRQLLPRRKYPYKCLNKLTGLSSHCQVPDSVLWV